MPGVDGRKNPRPGDCDVQPALDADKKNESDSGLGERKSETGAGMKESDISKYLLAIPN